MILHLPLLTPYLLKEENDSTRLLQYGRARYGNYRRDRLRGNNRRNRPRGRNRRDRLGGNNRRGRNNNRKGTPRAVDPVGPCSWHSKKRDCRHDGRCTWGNFGLGYYECRREDQNSGGSSGACWGRDKPNCKHYSMCRWTGGPQGVGYCEPK